MHVIHTDIHTYVHIYIYVCVCVCVCACSTVEPFTESDDTRCCDNIVCPPEDGHVNARNMSRILM